MNNADLYKTLLSLENRIIKLEGVLKKLIEILEKSPDNSEVK